MQRKNFISRAMQALLDRLLNGGDVDWQTLGQALYRVLHSRDLLIALTDPHLNEPLHLAQLDGALRTDAGDHVMVVDTNMGFNKASVAMQQAMQYTVTLAADRAPQAELTIAYTNTNPFVPGCVSRPFNYDLDITYDELVQQCYWLYRRVLASPGAELIDASRHPAGPGELVSGLNSDGATRVTEENGKTVFGTFLIVPRGQRVDSRISLHAAGFSRASAWRPIELSSGVAEAAGRGRLADEGDCGVSGEHVTARSTTAAQPYDGQLGSVSV